MTVTKTRAPKRNRPPCWLVDLDLQPAGGQRRNVIAVVSVRPHAYEPGMWTMNLHGPYPGNGSPSTAQAHRDALMMSWGDEPRQRTTFHADSPEEAYERLEGLVRDWKARMLERMNAHIGELF